MDNSFAAQKYLQNQFVFEDFNFQLTFCNVIKTPTPQYVRCWRFKFFFTFALLLTIPLLTATVNRVPYNRYALNIMLSFAHREPVHHQQKDQQQLQFLHKSTG